MTLELDFSLVSPSNIGHYAACTDRLRRDTIRRPPRTPSRPATDFGSVCHYFGMKAVGAIGFEALTPIKEKDKGAIWQNALSMFASEHAMMIEVEKCTEVANARLPVLGEGVNWRCEVSQYDESILPKRLSRKGVSGFGGDIDLLSTDNRVLVDYKFVSKLPDLIKIEYLWQMGSYSILRDLNETIVLLTDRKTYQTATFTFKWKETEKWRTFRDQIRKFLDRLTHSNFLDYTYPMAGEHCDYCEHKDDCPAYNQVKPVFEMRSPLPKADSHTLGVFNKLMTQGGMAPVPAQKAPPPRPSLVDIANRVPNVDTNRYFS